MRLGKTRSTVTPDAEVILRRRMIGLEQSLMLDQERCCGCGDCEIVCPTEAVSITDPVVTDGRVLKKAVVDIDPAACTYCGECAVICPTKAISWRENEETVPTVITEGILPVLDEEIEIDQERCRTTVSLPARKSVRRTRSRSRSRMMSQAKPGSPMWWWTVRAACTADAASRCVPMG